MGSTKISSPAPPSYSGSMREILTSQIELMPRVFAAEQQFQPEFARLQADTQEYLTQRGLQDLKTLYPEIAGIEKQYIQDTAQNELDRLKQQLPEYKQTFEALTPGYSEAVQQMGNLAKQQASLAMQRPEFRDYTAGIADANAGKIAGQVQQYRPGGYLSAVQGPQEAGFTRGIRGPARTSGLENVDQGLVNQYMATMPGMQQYAQSLSDVAQQELAAGRGLTAEEERMSQQAARSAYAARGTLLGPQAASAEVLNRADVANQRLQQRMAIAQQAAGQIQGLYSPALEQAMERQRIGAEYGLSAQAQRFGQAQAREQLAQQLQKEKYSQALGREELLAKSQAQEFGQAISMEDLAAQEQERRFGQAAQREGMDIARQMSANELQAARAQLASGAMSNLQGSLSPILSAFYKQPMMGNVPSYLQGFGLNAESAMGPQLFNPESPTGMGSIYGAYNAQTQLKAAEAQAKAGRSAGMMSMGGAIGGAAIVGGAIIF